MPERPAEMHGFCRNVTDRLLRSSPSRRVRRPVTRSSRDRNDVKRRQTQPHVRERALPPSHFARAARSPPVLDAQSQSGTPDTPHPGASFLRADTCCPHLGAERGEQPLNCAGTWVAASGTAVGPTCRFVAPIARGSLTWAPSLPCEAAFFE